MPLRLACGSQLSAAGTCGWPQALLPRQQMPLRPMPTVAAGVAGVAMTAMQVTRAGSRSWFPGALMTWVSWGRA